MTPRNIISRHDLIIPICKEWKVLTYMHKSETMLLSPVNSYNQGRIIVPALWLGHISTYAYYIPGDVKPNFSSGETEYFTLKENKITYDIRMNIKEFNSLGLYYIQTAPNLNEWITKIANKKIENSEHQTAHHAIGSIIQNTSMVCEVIKIFFRPPDYTHLPIRYYEDSWEEQDIPKMFTVYNDLHGCWADLPEKLFTKYERNSR